MNRSIAFLAALAVSAGLTGCSFQGHDGSTNISKPGTSVTHAPSAPTHPGARCRPHYACPQ